MAKRWSEIDSKFNVLKRNEIEWHTEIFLIRAMYFAITGYMQLDHDRGRRWKTVSHQLPSLFIPLCFVVNRAIDSWKQC